MDTPVAGLRERDVRNGIPKLLTFKPWTMAPYLPQILARPRWLAGFIAGRRIDDVSERGPSRDWCDALRERRPGAGTIGGDLGRSRLDSSGLAGPIIVKGLLTGEDARRAVDAGADAIVVSNHGGRQLDTVAATLKALPEIVDVVRGRIDVLVDGGIRRGGDIVKALCLGARAVLVGRAYAYGLAAAGEAGVNRAVEILRADLVRTLKLLGCESTAALTRDYIEVPTDWRPVSHPVKATY